MKKATFILIFVFLIGCGRKEDIQYPLIATPSEAKGIDFVIVSEGIYCIFDGEAYGFITEDGEEIAPCIYDIAYPFSEGLACVCKDGKYGYIDLRGEIAIPFDYDRATPFVEGLAYFSIGNTYGFMDKTGTPVLYFECDSISSFQEGLAYFSVDGRYGYIDQHGQIAIEPVFDDAGYFKEGLAKVMKDGRYGIINRNGAFVVAAEYDSITITGSFIIAQSEGKYACFDRSGKALLEQTDDIYALAKEKYVRFKREGKWGLIDEKGNILIEPLFDWLSLLTPEQNLLIIQEGDLYGVANLQGEVRIPAVYDQIVYDSYVDSTEGGMFLLTDTDGNMESIDATDFSEKIPCNYDSIDWLSKDKAVVSLGGLSGIIDREGNLIEPIAYDTIRVFTDGAVWMKKDEKSWFYNRRGEAVEDIDYYDNISEIGNCYQTEKDGKYGFLNEQGEKVVSPVYNKISDYKVCRSSFNVYVLINYDSDVGDSIIKTGDFVEADISRVILQNEITPRIGLYREFTQSGSISVDGSLGGYTASQENLRGCRKTYKLYDFEHSGETILYFEAEPYMRINFPESYSGFYTIKNNQLVELFTGYECGGSLRGDYVCFWYDKETSRVLPGTNGLWGGFGGYYNYGAVYDSIASFGHMNQPIGNYSAEELEHAELVYDQENRPYTKEVLEQTEGGIVQIYSVNDAQTTIEEYQEMKARYQILFYVE